MPTLLTFFSFLVLFSFVLYCQVRACNYNSAQLSEVDTVKAVVRPPTPSFTSLVRSTRAVSKGQINRKPRINCERRHWIVKRVPFHFLVFLVFLSSPTSLSVRKGNVRFSSYIEGAPQSWYFSGHLNPTLSVSCYQKVDQRLCNLKYCRKKSHLSSNTIHIHSAAFDHDMFFFLRTCLVYY